MNATKRIGELLLEKEMVTARQLRETLELQPSMPGQTIGQLLCRLGYVKEADLRFLLDHNNKRPDLGAILVNNGLLSHRKLAIAKEVVKQQRISLESALLKLGYLDEEQVAQSVAIQYDLSYMHISGSRDLQADAIQYISAAFARTHRLAPISKVGSTLTLAMAKPLHQNSIRELEDVMGFRINAVIVSETSMRLAHKLMYNIADDGKGAAVGEELNLNLPDSIAELLSESTLSDEPDVEEESKQVTEKDNVIVKLVNKIIYDAYLKKASDIHIEPSAGKNDVIVRIRIDGHCSIYQKIPYRYKFAIISRIKIMADLDISERRKPQDGKIEFRKFGPLGIELRVATMPTVNGLEDAVIRILSNSEPLAFKDLGLSNRNRRIFEENLLSPHGLVLVVGPTGSGKTTTLHSGLATINQPHRKIWTAEDPVEITQFGLRQVQVNPRIGFGFAAALRSFLRLDPDIIMVGEMRDEETASIALEASLTGHLVFSTLHTNSAPETITRLLEMGLDPFSFSDSLLCILAQRLVRRLCPDCKENYRPTAEEFDELIEEYGTGFSLPQADRDTVVMGRAVGCEQCNHSGYRSRMGIHEVLRCTPELKKLIKKRSRTDVIQAQAVSDGMTTLRQDGILKVLQGFTDINEVRRVCVK
ncbi:GspE/PulE family protein [Geobacter sp. SVR]|uniref:GspE/PulE family protein n=1 Tax=Geobacter sp. SVR TaxID=2495594 RepID=UPI00143F0493|nr:ATPase, T2SS/T4P/T4SS family [Geobacter sp. SVR]BCS54659.1 general secretory pathway protein GspE [Geobacter sp. SVR]GCF87599.1 general secretory pathway protein GspE [Geobacter sp. SVR]